MSKRTGPTNPDLANLIRELRTLGSQQNIPLWSRVAYDLEMPTRKRRVVNLSRLNRHTEEGETVVVPGKVLGSGMLDHKLTIAAFTFSKGALEQIRRTKSTALTLPEFMKQDIKGKKVRLMG